MNKIYRFNTWLFWKYYVVHMRPYLLFVSGIAGAAGIAMGKTTPGISKRAIIAFIIFFLGYGFGQALTDCFQTDTDRLSAPYRPLSKGIILVPDVLAVSAMGLLVSGILLWLLHPISCLLSVLAVFGLATYSYIKKHFWAAGPFYNSWIVALLPLMGYFAASTHTPTAGPPLFYPYVPVTFFSYTSFVLIGYLKDIEADKATQYKTFPVVWGWRKTVWANDIILAATFFFYWSRPMNGFPEFFAGAAASFTALYGQYTAHRSRGQNEIAALLPILSTVRSFILFHTAIVLHFKPGCWPVLLLYYGAFEWALYKRPSRYQV